MSALAPTALVRFWGLGASGSVRVAAPLVGDDLDLWFSEVVGPELPWARPRGVVGQVVSVSSDEAGALVGESFSW